MDDAQIAAFAKALSDGGNRALEQMHAKGCQRVRAIGVAVLCEHNSVIWLGNFNSRDPSTRYEIMEGLQEVFAEQLNKRDAAAAETLGVKPIVAKRDIK